MVIRGLFLTLTLVSLAACTGKPSRRTEHQGPLQEKVVDYVKAADAGDTVRSLYAQRFAYSDRINKAGTAQAKLDIALELEKTVLAPGTLSDAKIYGLTEFDSVLGLFHRALDLAITADRKLVADSGILDRYERAALAHCVGDGQSCIRLPLFKGDSLGSKILMRVAESLEPTINALRAERTGFLLRLKPPSASASAAEKAAFEKAEPELRQKLSEIEKKFFPPVLRYYRLLMYAYEISNSNANPELDQKYVQMARDYYDYIKTKSSVVQRGDFNRRHQDKLSRALGHLRNQSKNGRLDARYCKFLIEVNPLDPETFHSMGLDKRTQLSMTGEFIACAVQDGKLQSMIGAFNQKQWEIAVKNFNDDQLAESKKLSEAEGGGYAVNRIITKDRGYAYSLAAVQATPSLALGLEIPLTMRKDLAAFIIDKVFYGQMDQTVALAYWRRLEKPNDLELLQFIHGYARLQTAYVLRTTLLNYNRVMKERYADGKLGSEFFSDVMREVNASSSSSWTDLIDRLTSVRQFTEKVYDGRYGRTVSGDANLKIQKEYLAIKAQLSELPTHFSQAVSVPMNLPLYYYMAKSQGTIRIYYSRLRGNDKYFDIDASAALNAYFQPVSTPQQALIEIGEEFFRTDFLQKMHALDFAMRIGIFDIIDFKLLAEDRANDKPAEVLFFTQLLKDGLQKKENDLRKTYENLLYRSKSNEFEDIFLKTCADPLRAGLSLKLESIAQGTYITNTTLRNSLELLYGRNQTIEDWRNRRETVQQLISVVEKNYLAKDAAKRLTPEKLAASRKIVDDIKGLIERYDDLERKLYALQFQVDQQVVMANGNCIDRISKAEKLRTDALLLANVEYYKNVHAAMALLNLAPDVSETVNSARQKLAGAALEDDVRQRAVKLLDLLDRQRLLEPLIAKNGQTVAPALTLSEALNETVKVNNYVSDPRLKGVGFYVEGSWAAEGPFDAGNRIRSMNRIKADRFFQTRWDAFMRARSLYATLTIDGREANRRLGVNIYPAGPMLIAPDVNFPIPSRNEFESGSNAMYAVVPPDDTPYFADQRTFVRRAMTRFAGEMNPYVGWMMESGYSPSWYRTRLSWLLQLARMNAIATEPTDSTQCAKDVWGALVATRDVGGRPTVDAQANPACKAVRVSGPDLVDAYMQLIRGLEMSETDMDLSDLTSQKGRLTGQYTTLLQYDNDANTTNWTYFDWYYRKNISSVSGFMDDGADGIETKTFEYIRGKQEFADLFTSWQNNIDNASPLFPFRAETTQVRRDVLREKIHKHVERIQEFEDVVFNMEEIDYLKNRRLPDLVIEQVTAKVAAMDEPSFPSRYSPDQVWRVMKVTPRSNGNRSGRPIYLNDEHSRDLSARKWFADFIRGFIVKDVSCNFLEMPSDPDFTRKYAENRTCLDHYREWQARQNAKRKSRQEALMPIVREMKLTGE